MKKLVLLFALSIFFVFNLNVYAEGETQPDTTQPTSGDTSETSTESTTEQILPVTTETSTEVTTEKPKPKKKKPKKIKGKKIKIGKKKVYTYQLKGKFKKDKKGYKYFKAKDKKERKKKGFFTYKGNVYYKDKTGKIKTGWFKYKKNYYYLDRTTGKMTFSDEVNDVWVNKYGVAKPLGYKAERIDVFIQARKVIEETSDPKDSKSEKLYKAYDYLGNFIYVRHRTYREAAASNPIDWDIVFANDMFLDDKHGCCVSSSAAFAYTAVELGYTNVSLCCDGEHSWVDIDGRLYDLIFAKNKSFELNYDAEYTDYRAHPVISKRID